MNCFLLLLRARPCLIFSPVSKAKSAVCRNVSTGPQSFLLASTWLGHVSRLKVSKVGQDCRMWLGVWRPVPHGHSSEWEIFSLWRWEELTVFTSRSKDCDLCCSVRLVDAVLFIPMFSTVGGYSSKAWSPSFCLWGWPTLLPEVCSQSAAGHWRWCSCCCQCQVLCTARQSAFGTWTSLPFCSSSWVPSSERWSFLPVSLSVEPAGGHCLPAGCKPLFFWISSLAIARSWMLNVFHARERCVGWSSGLLMRMRLISTIQSSICSPLLLRSAYPKLGEWPLKSPVMNRLWMNSGRVCSCRSLSGCQQQLITVISLP